ncbi:alanine/ornithine racemase family PLP-dependent enzyme [Eubacteriaceae bacterium ES3]|nr:alanine/ornithine racemase family PLP-dependent enzyme [Eubacteriaceae bacterium ES3]
MVPQLKINLKKIYENAKLIVAKAKTQGISVTAITKLTGGEPRVAQTYLDAGVSAIGDSRILNLQKMSSLSCEKWLIRLPAPGEVNEVVSFSDVSLNSEIKTISLLNEAAVRQNKKHSILYMVDLGDLREGLFLGDGRQTSPENKKLIAKNFEKLSRDIETIKKMTNIEIKGLATNATCVGATIPNPQTFGALKLAADKLKETHKLPVEIISGGNSSAWHLVNQKTLPGYINNLRLGELILLGRETAFGEIFSDLNQDVFTLEAEIIEIQEKPTYPLGEIGVNAFGEKPVFVDKGIRRRAICALGRQDTDTDHIFPLDDKILVEGSSSDHLVLDITDSKYAYDIGDVLSFRCDYSGALHAATTEYINKVLI